MYWGPVALEMPSKITLDSGIQGNHAGSEYVITKHGCFESCGFNWIIALTFLPTQSDQKITDLDMLINRRIIWVGWEVVYSIIVVPKPVTQFT